MGDEYSPVQCDLDPQRACSAPAAGIGARKQREAIPDNCFNQVRVTCHRLIDELPVRKS